MENKNHNEQTKNETIILTNAQNNYGGNLREIIFTNSMYEIGKYLLKNEKINLRQLNKHFYEFTFPLFNLFINIKNKNDNDEYLPKNISFPKILKNFSIIDKLNIENIKLNQEILKGLEIISVNNNENINSLSLINVDYDGIDNILYTQNLINKMNFLEEFKIANIGNKDKLFINLEKNSKILKIYKIIKTLKIDNIPVKQIIYLLNSFVNIDNLTIENCSLDEELQQIEINLNKNLKNKNEKGLNLKSLNLSLNGLSSQIALESLQKIIRNQKNLESLILRGMWFQEIYPLNDDLKLLEKLNSIDLFGSKNIFKGLNSVYIFTAIQNLKFLNLGDTRMEDSHLEKILQGLISKKNYNLEELNLLRCSLTDHAINLLLQYSEILPNLKILNLDFNRGITEKGFNKFLENYFMIKSLKSLNLKNTGISLKYSFKNISKFILNFSKMKINSKNELERIKNLGYDKKETPNLSTDIKNNEINIDRDNKLINETTNIGFNFENNEINLKNIDLYFCTLYDNDYHNLIELVLNTLKDNKINGFLDFKLGLKIFYNKKPIFKKVESLQNELYKNYNLIIK